jgi:hypothetical protein
VKVTKREGQGRRSQEEGSSLKHENRAGEAVGKDRRGESAEVKLAQL